MSPHKSTCFLRSEAKTFVIIFLCLVETWHVVNTQDNVLDIDIRVNLQRI